MTAYIATYLVVPTGGVVKLPADNAGTRADKFLQWSSDGLTLENTVLTDGADGADGADGQGVPVGGTTRQVLAKINGTDFNTEWHTVVLADITDLTVTASYVEFPVGLRPWIDDDLAPAGVGYLFESVNDGHLYWVHRDGGVHLLCSDSGYGSGSSGVSYSPGHLTIGAYFTTYGDSVPVTLAVPADRQFFVPFYVGYDRTAGAVAVYVNTPTASSNVRLGIYENDNGKPGALLIDGGSVSTSTTGNKPAVMSQALPAGWYWLSALFSHTVSVVGDPCVAGSRLRLLSMNESASYYVYTDTAYGMLPATPSGTLLWSDVASNPNVPRIGIAFT